MARNTGVHEPVPASKTESGRSARTHDTLFCLPRICACRPKSASDPNSTVPAMLSAGGPDSSAWRDASEQRSSLLRSPRPPKGKAV